MSSFTLHHGNCLDILRAMPDNSIDSIVTDPPYGFSFMGKKWDYDVPSEEIWSECLRVLKPGGHLLAFAGTRTQHRMCCRIEDAGFEIRDMIAWAYGSGFPKSLDVSKAIDRQCGMLKTEGAGFTVAGYSHAPDKLLHTAPSRGYVYVRPAPATPEAKQWQGWGTSLKPALEPITVARKPLVGTVAENVLKYGTGGINVDGCRVLDGSETWRDKPEYKPNYLNSVYGSGMGGGIWENTSGRWPANFIHDGSDEAIGLLGDSARFFFCSKASKKDREDGCEFLDQKKGGWMNSRPRPGKPTNRPVRANHHPTVKPTDLMRYLCRLVTPPSGIILDPFMGSGSTGKAAMIEGFHFVGIELDEEYLKIAQARISSAQLPIESV